MEGTTLRIVFVLSLWLGVACATPPEISVDQRDEFSHFRTWNWFPGAAPSIDATGSDAAGLDRDLARLVERELERLGFERIRDEPDLWVGVRLDVRREEVSVYETGAIQQLSSLHFSASYQVQAPVKRRQTYEYSRLVIFATDALRGRVVWEGTLEDRVRGRFSPHLERTIAGLLERFPPAGRASTGGPPPARDPATGDPSMFTGTPLRSSADTSS